MSASRPFKAPQAQSLIAMLIVVLAFAPLAYSQSTTPSPSRGESQFDPSSSIARLERQTLFLRGSHRLILNFQDKADWQDLAGKDLAKYDRRLTTQTLPYLVSERGGNLPLLVVDRIRRDYDSEQTKTSRQFDGASNESQHYYGKVATISAIGQTTCFSEAMFPPRLTNLKPLWLHYQLGPVESNQLWPWGRGFDQAARQAFWLQARGLTGRLITPNSWSAFLQQVAKAELEDRFRLPAGTLGLSPVGELAQDLAAGRLAAQLGLPSLPIAESEDDFYARLGQLAIERGLLLPEGSFFGDNWQSLYREVGFRVLEDSLGLRPSQSEPSPFAGENLTEQPRFRLLANQLQNRAEHYLDAHLALNLPPKGYFSTTAGQSTLLERLQNGDPTAFATSGAYFLADSLALRPEETEQLIKAVESGEERAPSLANARPLNPDHRPAELFAADITAAKREEIYQAIGQRYQAIIEQNLGRINESVLMAISGDSRAPRYNSLISTLTNASRRQEALGLLARSSVVDANYSDGFSAETLRRRGMTIVADTLDLPEALIRQLSDPSIDSESEAVEQAATAIDEWMGWPPGTAKIFARQEGQSDSSAAVAASQRILQIGANILWQQFGLPVDLRPDLNRHFFESLAERPTDDGLEDSGEIIDLAGDDILEGELIEEFIELGGESSPTDASPSEELNDESGSSTEGEDEIIFSRLNIEPAQQPLTERIGAVTGLNSEQISYLMAGRFLPALTRLTAARLGRLLATDSTITPARLAEAIDGASPEALTSLAEQSNVWQASQVVSSRLLRELEEAKGGGNSFLLWQTMFNIVASQWGLGCDDKQFEVTEAIDNLVKLLVALSAEKQANEPAERPVQIFTYAKDKLSQSTLDAISTAYPEADGRNNKWGLYSAPRAWDHIYIGY